jgi:hypothetical protein
MITIYRNIFDKTNPNYITIDKALERIKVGRSAEKIAEIRKQLDKERADKLKCNLPSVCFSGKFQERTDSGLLEHSGFICLDFDNLEDVQDAKSQLCTNEFIYACWISPRANGLKALVKIADGKQHRLHFQALKEIFPEIDNSGINESRVCFESHDPDIFINKKAAIFRKTKAIEQQTTYERSNYTESFQKLLKWQINKGNAFVSGERNIFLFKLAGACCRFGIHESDTISLCAMEFNIGFDSFTHSELEKVVKSAYKQNRSQYGTAQFEREVLVEKVNRKEVEIDADIFNPEIRPKDVIFGEDVKADALNLYDKGYPSLLALDVPDLDAHFKFKKGEITLLTGIGNYGKSTFLKWFLIMRVIKFKEKFALFSPEDNPAHEFYHDLVEIYAGMKLTPESTYRITRENYEQIYDYLSKHIFYVYPKEISPTPDYIKERFLEMIIKEKIDGCIIDPFNQMTNEYAKSGGRSDKYLETFLADCSRFAQLNNVYFTIVAHPHKMQKDSTGNYPCPDVFDIADGAMWNNKMDNILVYHRPEHQKNPDSNSCELHTKKIRRQRVVGKKGVVYFALQKGFRRYLFDSGDPMGKVIEAEKQKPIDDIPF